MTQTWNRMIWMTYRWCHIYTLTHVASINQIFWHVFIFRFYKVGWSAINSESCDYRRRFSEIFWYFWAKTYLEHNFIFSYTSDKWKNDYAPTIFDRYTFQVQIDGRDYSLEILDTAGQGTWFHLPESLSSWNFMIYLNVISYLLNSLCSLVRFFVRPWPNPTTGTRWMKLNQISSKSWIFNFWKAKFPEIFWPRKILVGSKEFEFFGGGQCGYQD